jgi:hypothetical protein
LRSRRVQSGDINRVEERRGIVKSDLVGRSIDEKLAMAVEICDA